MFVIIVGFGAAIFYRSPWPPLATVKHAVAFAGCDAARWVGLAPAVKGNPGYWQRLDHNGTGWSCERDAS
ncbi:MAG TPA: excalibur calcium-binding domain-containing protein [Saliniramus sp.]|nr:excalibur calcium-binding domain-containing protein [Saliniramus sp.]